MQQDMSSLMKVPKMMVEVKQRFKELKMELAWIQKCLQER